MNSVLNVLYLGLTEKGRLSLIWVFYPTAGVALAIAINNTSSLSLFFSLSHTHKWNAAEGKSKTKYRKNEGMEHRP